MAGETFKAVTCPNRGAAASANCPDPAPGSTTALHLLRDEGLLEFRRGRAITVSGTPPRGAVLTQVRNLLQFARQHGYERGEIIQMIKNLPQDA